jgi:hypothetical protein
MPETTPISLAAGWSIISYLRDTSAAIGTALSTINDTLLLAKDNAGRVYWPAYGINQIGNMQPGQGYQVYLIAPDTLTYPTNSPTGTTSDAIQPEDNIVHFTDCITNTGANSTMIIPAGTPEIDLPEGVMLEEGDELAIFSSEVGLCVGALSWDGVIDAQAMTIWGDNELTEEIDGLVEVEEMSWKLWDRSEDKEHEIKVTYRQSIHLNGDGIFYKDNIYVLESLLPYRLFLPMLNQ